MNTQVRSLSHHRRLLDNGGNPFAAAILATGPIAYWPLWETAGTAAECLVNSAQNGAYTGVTLNDTLGPDGLNGAPFFDGANDYVNIYTATFAAAFNGATGSLLVWMKVAGAGVWTDATIRFVSNIECNPVNVNLYKIQRTTVNGTLLFGGKAGGSSAQHNKTGAADTTWIPCAMTWSDEANDDEFIGYYNGAALGAPNAGLGTWAGTPLLSSRVILGSQTTTPNAPWHGWLAHCAVWDRVLGAAEIAALSAA